MALLFVPRILHAFLWKGVMTMTMVLGIILVVVGVYIILGGKKD